MTISKDEYTRNDGLGLAELLHRGEVSPRELMEQAVGLAVEHNPAVNALCYERYDYALEQAAAAVLQGTFGALPFLLKDTGLGSTSLQSAVGSRLFAGMKSTLNATLNKRFMGDGFLSFGRTTVPEFCMAPTTEAVQNGGPTRNPWELTRSSGGSSGGAAVAVATGIVPIAHGSDGGGSIRIPASCCGVFGLKPSRGLVPCGPQRGESWGGLAVDGVITRTVRDTAAALDGIVGMEVGAPYAAPAHPDSYSARLETPFERPLRIAVWASAWEDISVAPECLDAVRKAKALLSELGHETVDAIPPELNYGSFVDSIITVMAANVAVTVNGYIRNGPKRDLENFLEPAIYDAYEIGANLSAEAYVLAINRFHAMSRILEIYMEAYDFVLTPTLTELPALLGKFSMNDDFRSFRRKAARYTAFLAIVNAAGRPAASVPLHWSAQELPVGIQLIGRFGAESELLRVCAQLERASPWQHRRPSLAR